MGRRKLMSIEAAYDVLVSEHQRLGGMPTMREFSQALGACSSRTAQRYIGWLEDAGYIERTGRHGVRFNQ